MSNLKENETEYDYNLGQGRPVEQYNVSINILSAIISLILIGGIALILYKAFML